MLARHSIPLLAAAPALCPAADKITFDDHVFPIFQQSCLNCHNPDKIKGGLDLSTFAATIKGGSGGKIAEPGDPASKLLALVTHSAEPKMPPEGDKLDQARIDTLKAWIEGGLLETKDSSARKPTKPKLDVALQGDPTAKPDGPPPLPADLLLEPVIAPPAGTAVRALAASPWAPLLAVTGQRQVLLYHTETLRLAGVLPFPDGDPACLAFTPDARYLLAGGGTGGKSGTTIAWDVTNGRELLRAGREFDTVLAADLRPDFARVATGSPSRLLKLWDTTTNEAAHSIKKHTDWITALDFSPDGVLLASGDRNGGVWVWEAATAAEFHTLRAHQARITSLAFRPDSNLLASASEDGTVRFWEMNGGSEVRKLDAHPGGVTAFAWARDGSFATTGRDSKLKAWKPDFSLLKEIPLDGALPTSLALAADATTAFVGDWSGAVTVVRLADGSKPAKLPSNPPAIATRLAILHEQLRTHSQAVAGAEAALLDATTKLAAARKAAEDATAAVHAAEQAHPAAVAAAEQAKQRLAELDARIAQLDATTTAQRTARDQARADAERLASTPGPELDQARTRLAELDPAVAKLEADLAQVRTERQPLADQLAAATTAAQSAQAAIDPARQRAAEAAKPIPPAEQAVAEATKALETTRAHRTTLEQDQQFWQAAAARAEALRKQNESPPPDQTAAPAQ